jgi:hypothetical protein
MAMAQQGSTPEVPVTDPAQPGGPYAGVQYSEATGWVAWVLFGGILLVLLGALHLSIGLVALWRPEVLAATRGELLLSIGLTALAWIHVVLGAAAAVLGVGLMLGRRWARAGAIVLACGSAAVNFAFVGVYPVWSVAAVSLAAILIYAVARHGAEVADAYGHS